MNKTIDYVIRKDIIGQVIRKDKANIRKIDIVTI